MSNDSCYLPMPGASREIMFSIRTLLQAAKTSSSCILRVHDDSHEKFWPHVAHVAMLTLSRLKDASIVCSWQVDLSYGQH